MSALQLCNNVVRPLVITPSHVIQHQGEVALMDEIPTIIGNFRAMAVFTRVPSSHEIDKYSPLCQPVGRKG
jgi:hypothetical protein